MGQPTPYQNSPSPNLTTLTSTLKHIMRGALTRSSAASYQRSWALFSDFIKQYDIQGNFPISITTLSLFIAFLAQRGYKPSTISSYVSAIGYMHKIQGIQDPTGAFLIIQLLKSLHKNNPSADTRLPIDKQVLDKLIWALPYVSRSRFEICLFASMFALAFHAFLRIGEITKRSIKEENLHLLQLQNVQFDKDYFVLKFESYKHSQGKAFFLKVTKTKDGSSCPLKLLLRYLTLRGDAGGPLFCQQSGLPILRRDFDEFLRKALVFNKINPKSFKGHSFRIGAATSAAAQGLSENTIKQMGRWKSDAYMKYIRNASNTSSL